MSDRRASAIDLPAAGTRTETDSMGAIEVPADRYWGAQTQRSAAPLLDRRRPHAASRLSRATAREEGGGAASTSRPGALPPWKAPRHSRAPPTRCIAGQLDDDFPLYVWQTGSGTQSNMNVNEVLANRAIQLLGGARRAASSRSIRTTT